MKQTLEQRLLAIAVRLDKEADYWNKRAEYASAENLADEAEAIRALAKEAAGRVLTRPEVTDYKGKYKGKTVACRLASITIGALKHHGAGKTDEEALANLQWQIDGIEAPSPSTPKQTWPSDPRVVNAESWHRMSAEEQERYVQQHNLTIGCTADIGDEIRYGWGAVDGNGFWQFPCDWHTPAPAKARKGG